MSYVTEGSDRGGIGDKNGSDVCKTAHLKIYNIYSQQYHKEFKFYITNILSRKKFR